MPKFVATLRQHEWVTAEQWEIEADDEQAAQAQAEDFVNAEKDLEGREFEVTVEAAPEPEAEASPEEAPAEDIQADVEPETESPKADTAGADQENA